MLVRAQSRQWPRASPFEYRSRLVLTDNICRNLEWMVCAAQGKVPGQGDDRVIRFAKAPNTLELSGLGQCRGWVPEDRPAGFVFGYATADIFYLEACLFSQMCVHVHMYIHVHVHA